jgi:thioredoxin reductase
MNMKRIAVLGAGPVGIEAALRGVRRGFDVFVCEQGDIGDNVLAWGHVRMFSPWHMNVSDLGAELLQDPGLRTEECPTGREYAERYLLPLARRPELRGRIHAGERVVAVSRRGALKGELIGEPARGRRPFRILTEDRAGRERTREADVVLDCTGIYRVPNALGDGGIPAPGERRAGRLISHEIDDVTGHDRTRYAGKRILLVGNGHSAAHSAVALSELAAREPKTRIVWAVRSGRPPVAEIAGDPLAERARVVRAANALAEGGSPALELVPGAVVDSLEPAGAGIRVFLRVGEEIRALEVDRILANVGCGPDNSLYRELQVHECYASRGPMKLAAALLGERSADCLTQQSKGVEVLRSPETDFFLLGAKSYGRSPGFLVRVGFAQVREVYEALA